MAFQTHRSSGNSRGRTRTPPMSEINVTPMVDVMLVLLIVFMVTAPLLTVGVQIDLPKTKAKTNRWPSPSTPRDRSIFRIRKSTSKDLSPGCAPSPTTIPTFGYSCAATRRSITAGSWRSWEPSTPPDTRKWRWSPSNRKSAAGRKKADARFSRNFTCVTRLSIRSCLMP